MSITGGGGSAPTTPHWDSEVHHLQAFCPLEICFFLCKTQGAGVKLQALAFWRLAPMVSVRTYQGKYAEVL